MNHQAFPGLVDNFVLFIFGDIANHSRLADKIVRLKWTTRHFPNAAHPLLLADNPEFFGGQDRRPRLRDHPAGFA